MSLYREPRSTLLHLLEKENNIILDPSDYDFSIPEPASPPDGSDASYNTKITISSNNPAAPYIGSVDIFYNRLNLADLNLLVNIVIHSPDASSAHQVIPSMNRRYGLNFTEDDLEDLQSTEEDGYLIVKLKAKESSLAWTGEIDIPAVQGDLLLEDYLVEGVLGGLNYPTEDFSRPFAHFYSYWRSFSEHHDYLTTVKAGDSISLELVSVLNDITKDPWVATGTTEFSLDNAQIVYSGPTANYPNTNKDYDDVVIIALDPDKCTGMSGSLVLHHTSDPLATLGI